MNRRGEAGEGNSVRTRSSPPSPPGAGLLETPPRRICILLAGALGDFITSLPALDRLRTTFPSARIDLVGNPHWSPLAAETGWVDEVRSIEALPLHTGFMERVPSTHPLRAFFSTYDLVVSWFGDREGRWRKNLEEMARGKVLVHPFHQVHTFPGHASEYYLATLRQSGILHGVTDDAGHPPAMPTLRCPGGRPASPLPPAHGPYLCLHPGSGSPRKNWPPRRFLEVALLVRRKWGLSCLVLLGPAEEDQQEFWRTEEGSRLLVREGPDILEACRLLARAHLYVGNDSGISHLSAALGTPSVVIFGPTDPARWAPRGKRVEILSGGHPTGEGSSPDRVTVESVMEALGRVKEGE